MKKFKISVQKREKLGKSETKRLRKLLMVPCVMYGGEENLHFYAHENDFSKLVYTPEVHLVEINLENKMHKAIIQEIQFHPVTDKIIHIDFIEVFDDKPVIASIPIELTGSSIGIKNGGKLRQKRRYLKVKGLIADLPEKLTIDITKVNIGDVVKVGDLKYPNLDLLDPHRSMVVSIVSSRVALKGMTTDEPAEEETTDSEAEKTDAEGEEKPE
ncbi:MAG: 50S ribosomal protein L25/general stress protein Ctc [Bacteroidales bacterium]|nr:50S ribosomal protein L25/general stress protein Ctc [Bacteroidales bacterium]